MRLGRFSKFIECAMMMMIACRRISPTAEHNSSEYFLHINHWLVYFARLEKSEANFWRRGGKNSNNHIIALLSMSWCAGLFSFSACFWSHPNFCLKFGMIPASYKMRHIIFDGWRKRSFSVAWIFHELHTCSKTTIFGVKFRSFYVVEVFCVIFGAKIQIF